MDNRGRGGYDASSIGNDKSEKSLKICNAMKNLDDNTKRKILDIIEQASGSAINQDAYDFIPFDGCGDDDDKPPSDESEGHEDLNQDEDEGCENDDNCNDAVCCEVDWKYSRGFRNYFCLYRKKYCGKPCYESLKSAQEHYRDLCGPEKAVFRNLDRRDPNCPKKCDPCGNP